nr:gephyrin-like molybdotransferase Glp [Cognatishimia sp. MH4019]
MVDWSASNTPSPAKPKKDAIFVGQDDRQPVYCRTRADAMALIEERLRSTPGRILLGFDFAFGFPPGFAEALTGRAEARAVWADLACRIRDGKNNENNRFQVADAINAATPGEGPFWGRPVGLTLPHLDMTKRRTAAYPEFRAIEGHSKGAKSVWQLAGAGAVGSQTLIGLAHLHRLCEAFGDEIAVWPQNTGWSKPDARITLVEIYPALLNRAPLDALCEGWDKSDPVYEIPDAVQVRGLCHAFHQAQKQGLLDRFFAEPAGLPDPAQIAREEGWILGVTTDEIKPQKTLQPPPLRNDCFALPPGVDWTPVDDALALLKERLTVVTPVDTAPLSAALGRVLADPLTAPRAQPPAPNSAVDGYGFAHASLGDGPHRLPLLQGRAAAGVPFTDPVPHGAAIRILTGAILPDGVDTVVLEEDVSTDGQAIAFRDGVKPGANTRKAGEDVEKGEHLLTKGHVMRPADIAHLASVGIETVPLHRRLRVAVISTGDELRDPHEDAGTGQIYDANRPMLLSLIADLGYTPVDMGRLPDDRRVIREGLSDAAQKADVILTSGGASAGDEDHISALLTETGAMSMWRIAIKPGRPLALGMWDNTPVFGLPGNPVAALVCALIFARPAMSVLAGAKWRTPQGFDLPAAFTKRKKPGRREFLRARVVDGTVQVFASEGSGRISGLSWADGLVEIEDGARDIAPGDMVRYIPYASFLACNF